MILQTYCQPTEAGISKFGKCAFQVEGVLSRCWPFRCQCFCFCHDKWQWVLRYLGPLWTHFGVPRHALGTALRSFCLSFGNLCGLFGAPWAVLGHTLGRLGLHWDVLGASRDSMGDFASTRDSFASRGLSSTAPAHKNRPAGICIEIHPDEPMWLGNGPRTAVQDLPSTRAGDQDDVSFPNSLKLVAIIHISLSLCLSLSIYLYIYIYIYMLTINSCSFSNNVHFTKQ